MAHRKDNYEKSNAREWDEHSMISIAAPPQHPLIHHPAVNNGPGGSSASYQSTSAAYTRGGGHGIGYGIGQPNIASSQSGGSSSGSVNIITSTPTHNFYDRRNDNNSSGSQPGREARGRGLSNNQRHRQPSDRPRASEKPKMRWASPTKLTTTSRLKDQEDKAVKKAAVDKYLVRPDEDEFPATGYYLWPNKDETPMDLLGFKLEKLNPLRIAHKVWIEWDENTRCLKISSKSFQNSDLHIMPVIKGIRRYVEHEKAVAVSASPVYTVNPPTASAMREIVRPSKVGTNMASGTELSGAKFTEKQKAAWKIQRAIMAKSNLAMFRDQLVTSLMEMAAYKGWMRMRVHFGHVVFTDYRRDFAESKCSFEKFVHMIGLARTTGKLDRRIEDASIVMDVRKKIVDWPTRFRPVDGQQHSLEDVQFKDTEIIFVTTPSGEHLRIEADIDCIWDGNVSEYQIGSINVFEDNKRNKRVEMTTLDVEKQVDWSLELITDSSISVWPPELMTMVRDSVSAKSIARTDPLGLSFPHVTPRPQYKIKISTVIVRSVIQYMLDDSGYIVELAIYRTWDGSNTQPTPKMEASVSMFHRSWEWEMESIENTTKEREWDSSLKQFFDQGNTAESCGLSGFLSEIETIQGFLSAAQSAAKASENLSV